MFASMTWNRVLTGSLAGLILCFLGIMAINRVIIPPLLIFVIIFAALIVALPRLGERRWPYFAVALLMLAVLGGNAPFIIDDGAHPETFLTFVPTIWATIAAVSGLAASLAIALNRAPMLPRPFATAALGLAGAAFVLSVVLTATAGNDKIGPTDTVFMAERIGFPEKVEAPAGKGFFFIRNRDVVRHTFVIGGTGLKQELPAARDRRFEYDLKPGSYPFICDVPGHERMRGTLEVK